jgi:hypothetical protein
MNSLSVRTWSAPRHHPSEAIAAYLSAAGLSDEIIISTRRRARRLLISVRMPPLKHTSDFSWRLAANFVPATFKFGKRRTF